MAYHHDERGRGNKPYRRLWGGCTVDALALHYPFAMTSRGRAAPPHPALHKYHPYKEVGGQKKERKKEKRKRKKERNKKEKERKKNNGKQRKESEEKEKQRKERKGTLFGLYSENKRNIFSSSLLLVSSSSHHSS